MATRLMVALASVIGMLLGVLLAQWLLPEHLFVGVVGGAFVGLPLGLFLTTSRRRWLAVALLNAEFAFSYLVGHWFGLALTATAAALSYFIAAAVLRELYGGNEWQAIKSHLPLTFGLFRGFQIVEGGKTVVPASPKGPLMGPRLLIVRPASAVVCVQGARQTRIAGPGITTIAPFEYVRQTYDLQHKQRVLSMENVLTRDFMPCAFQVRVLYGIDIPPEVQRGQAPWTAAEAATLQRLDTTLRDWDLETVCVIEAVLRRGVAAITMRELLTPANQQPLEDTLLREANGQLQRSGLKVEEVLIENMQPGTEVPVVAAQQWAASEQIGVEAAKATATTQALSVLAAGYQVAKNLGMSELEIYREVLRRTLEVLAKDPASKLILTPELRDLISGTPK